MLTRDDPSGTPGAVRGIISSSDFSCQEILLDRSVSLRDRMAEDHLRLRDHGRAVLFPSR